MTEEIPKHPGVPQRLYTAKLFSSAALNETLNPTSTMTIVMMIK
jgi:hypothetical protein